MFRNVNHLGIFEAITTSILFLKLKGYRGLWNQSLSKYVNTCISWGNKDIIYQHSFWFTRNSAKLHCQVQ